MKACIIEDHKMSIETAETFIEKITEGLTSLDDGELLNVYFSSHGGEIATGNLITDFISNNGDRIVLTVYDTISSSGFEVFMNSKVKKKVVLDNAYAVIHLITDQLSYRDSKKEYSIGSKMIEDLDIINENLINRYKKTLNLSPSEVRMLEEGHELYISNGRLKQVFND